MQTSSFNPTGEPPGRCRAGLTVGQGLEAHLAAVLAVAGHGAGAHLHHVHHAGPQPLQPRRVRLAASHGRVVLVVVLQREPQSWDWGRGQQEGSRTEPVENGVWLQGGKGEVLVLLQECP